VNYTQLALGRFRALKLDSNGTSPAPPFGVPLFVQRPLPDYYQAAAAELTDDLAPHGYTVVQWAFDWRMLARSQAALLASHIRANVVSAEPCTLIGHSYGGLVARCVWANLLATGETALVRRIITLGTPHFGSYRPLALFAGADQLEGQLQVLSEVRAVGLLLTNLVPGQLPYSNLELAQICATWPALYELLPALPAPAGANDPLRPAVYDWRNYRGGAVPSAAWLDYARLQWWPFLATAASLPPADVLTTVAGTGVPTPARLVALDSLGTVSGIENDVEGDGAVTVDSALIADSAQITVPGLHGMLPLTLAQGDQLAELVMAERSPAPPPPPVSIPIQFRPIQSGPPLPIPLSSTADP
jgi:pimeloyl-ACP methyl ester carboxylesterase